MIDPKILTLIAVAETGNFTKAAEKLSLTQPAVSTHIRLLEEELGVRIFERSHRAMKLTQEGEAVLRTANRMIALTENLKQELSDEKSRVRALNVGITHTAESNAIAETLAAYARDNEITIRVVSHGVGHLKSMLKNYELDFIVAEGRMPDKDITHLMLDTDSLVLAVAPEHPLAKKKSVTVDRIRKENMILRRPSSNTRNLLVSSLESRGMSIDDFNVIMEIDNIGTIKDLIRRGIGVSVLAKSALTEELKRKKLAALEIKEFSMEREINLVHMNDYSHVDILQDIVKRYRKISGSTRD